MLLRKSAFAAPLALVLLAGAAAAQTPVVPALDPADIDSTCAPCKNFYRFATGGWAKRTPIPAAYSSWSGFNELADRNNELVRAVMETAAREAETTTDPDRRRLGRFYATCMDSARAEAEGARPIRGELDRIAAIRTRDALRKEITRLHGTGREVVFNAGSTRDVKNSRRNIFEVNQGGLGLPDRDFYFKTDSAAQKMRADYREHVAAMLRLLGDPPAKAAADADRILALETVLAEPSLNRLQRRDPAAQYHLMSVAEADALTPGFSWRTYLDARGLQRVDSLDVSHPEFFKAMARALDERPLEDWKAYLRFRTVNGAASWLSSPFVNQAFAYSSTLTGAQEMQPRWRRCLAQANTLLGDVLGREYASVAFTPEAKTAMDEMIDNLFAVYRERIETLPWMSEETRKQALQKLGTFDRKIGYPEQWRDYSGFEVARGHFLENLRRGVAFASRRDLEKVGTPVDRSEWFMTVPTVNAYYAPSSNEIVFPAGRLQPPFFHPAYDAGANYGGIGATIGHEISHGFDDQGRKYDAEGNLRDWWTRDDARRFGELAALAERQYGAYTVLDSLPLNAKQTMGENIADVAGVAIAFHAMQRALEGKPRVLIDGFTPEQRFFLAYAQARRQLWRDPALRLQVQTGVHSPGEFRVNGPLSNMPEFAAAWGCTAGDPMVRPEGERVKIW
ncbi:MAG TPA: M13 family metallopeptidase [Longimicrobiaceae bacterium]|nr:M13 family metallopeptidase [Longimicrobiaceae bacterium]